MALSSTMQQSIAMWGGRGRDPRHPRALDGRCAEGQVSQHDCACHLRLRPSGQPLCTSRSLALLSLCCRVAQVSSPSGTFLLR